MTDGNYAIKIMTTLQHILTRPHGVDAADIAEWQGCNRATAGRYIRVLERAGWIESEESSWRVEAKTSEGELVEVPTRYRRWKACPEIVSKIWDANRSMLELVDAERTPDQHYRAAIGGRR